MIDEAINKNRLQLMGIGAIGILLGHSTEIVNWTDSIGRLLSYGGIGVYIFVFLSSIGLYNSLKIRGKRYKKFDFYKRRFQRVFVPYLLIAASWYGIKYLVIQHDVLGFFYELSTISYWINHQGAWYVAMLIPVYLVFPWFYDWIEGGAKQQKGSRDIKIIAVGLAVLVGTFIVSVSNYQLYSHLAQIFFSVLVYIIGYYFADKVLAGEYKGYLLSTICIVLFVVKSITPLKEIDFVSSLSRNLFAIPIINVSTYFLAKINSKPINDFLAFFGRHSLEMYLCNIFLIQAVKYFGVVDWFEEQGDLSGYITYSLVIIGGIILSVMFAKLSGIVVKVVQNKNLSRSL